jgi:hypothetical protein
MAIVKRILLPVLLAPPLLGLLSGCIDSGSAKKESASQAATDHAPLLGAIASRTAMRNPYGHIPAQCYIETSGGTQNACLFCHSNGVFLQHLGNNNPQAGYEPVVGDLQQEYAFAAINYPFFANGSIMPWENTLYPQKLRKALDTLGIDDSAWDMHSYIRQDNWRAAFAERPGSPTNWDPGIDNPFRLFPGLDPADLPADSDGFVRSAKAEHGHFADDKGWITGWRAINFMPYGIFTPHSGSVSGVYIRLPKTFMLNAEGEFDLSAYSDNLALLERAIQDRLEPSDPSHYLGGASAVAVRRGLYPVGTEFAHPLHYVDVAADGSDTGISPFPGTRSRRVKEIRYMYKYEEWEPDSVAPGNKEEEAPPYVNASQGWINNNAGWYLAGFIEEADGRLRPQRASELMQCMGCHSGNVFPSDIAYGEFTSGTGNTIDSTWSFPRKFAAAAGWREMDYLGYIADLAAGAEATPGVATTAEPLNRQAAVGEFRFFLDHVVGVSLYGDMPASVETFLASRITRARGYSDNWPALDTTSPEGLLATQRLRQRLIRELTARGDYLDGNGRIEGALLYPPQTQALAGAARYRQVVATQRYDLGKDVFETTPFTYLYYRTTEESFSHQDGTPYTFGELITDRPIDTDPGSITYGIGIGKTLIDPQVPFTEGGNYVSDYVPLLATP